MPQCHSPHIALSAQFRLNASAMGNIPQCQQHASNHRFVRSLFGPVFALLNPDLQTDTGMCPSDSLHVADEFDCHAISLREALTCNQNVDSASSVAPDFWPCGGIVDLWVGRVFKLLQHVSSLCILHYLLSFLNGTCHAMRNDCRALDTESVGCA